MKKANLQSNIHKCFSMQAILFSECVLKLEGDSITAVDAVRYVDELKDTLDRRSKDGFLSQALKEEKTKLIASGFGSAVLTGLCCQFLGLYTILIHSII